MICARSSESISFPWLVSFSVDLLRGSMIHKRKDGHDKGAYQPYFRTDSDVSVVP